MPVVAKLITIVKALPIIAASAELTTFIAVLMSNPTLAAGFFVGLFLLLFGIFSAIGRLARRRRKV